MVGRATAENPMRANLEEAARLVPARMFLVNAVLDSARRIIQVVTGDPIAAHRAGVETSARMNGVRIPDPADIVIASSHPMDQDLRQGVNALANTLRAVRPGGLHITCARAIEGGGGMGLAERRLPVGPRTLHALAPLLLRLVPRRRVVCIELRARLVDHVGVLALEPVELTADHVGEPASAADHASVW